MSNHLQIAAWQRLEEVVKEYNRDDQTSRLKLHQAAVSYASTCKSTGTTKPAPGGKVVGTNGQTLRTGKVIPFGKSKGVPIEEADDDDLRWVAGALEKSISDPQKRRFAQDNRELLEAIHAELETR